MGKTDQMNLLDKGNEHMLSLPPNFSKIFFVFILFLV